MIESLIQSVPHVVLMAGGLVVVLVATQVVALVGSAVELGFCFFVLAPVAVSAAAAVPLLEAI